MNNKQIYYKQLINSELEPGFKPGRTFRIHPSFKLISILSIFYFLFSCNPDHPNFEPSYSGEPPEENMDQYLDTKAVFKGLDEVKGVRKQLDSLLTLTDKLKNYDDDVALIYADTAYSIATDKNWQLSRGISAYYISLLKGRKEKYGEGIEDALVDAKLSKEVFETLKCDIWITRSYNLIGFFHMRKNQIDTALKYLDNSKNIIDLGRLTANDSLIEKGELLHYYAMLYANNNHTLADSFFSSSTQLYRLTNNKSALARLNFDWGQMYYNRKEFLVAERLINDGLKYAQDFNDLNATVRGYQNLGRLRFKQYQSFGLEKYARESLQSYKKCFELQKEDKYFLYDQIGSLYQQMAFKSDTEDLAYSYVDSAIVSYKQAMEEAKKEGVLPIMKKMGSNISGLCSYRLRVRKMDCSNLLEGPLPDFLNTNYAGITEKIGDILKLANQRNRALERRELEAKSSLKVRNQRLASGVGFIVAGLLFILLLQRQQQKRLKAKMEALRAQINPHFISNSLNAIESLVNLDKKEAAAKYLIHFSRLSRRILNSSREGSASLAEELETLKHFLALEQLRFRDKLQYEIHISDDIDPEQVEIPAMILQPYAENAIWHGIKPKMEKGLLKIEARREGKYIQIIIEDDGVGRAKSAAMKASSVLQQKSVGMKINQERLHVMGRAKGAKVEIIDLFDENGQANGTKVVLKIPFKQMTKK
ncbi:MAG: histidine kinase [Saprospiraceae bacterium]